MKSYRLIGLLIPVFLLVYGQSVNNNAANGNALEEKEKLNLVTVHAEDAHLPSILAILAKESGYNIVTCLLYTSPSPRDGLLSRMPSSA